MQARLKHYNNNPAAKPSNSEDAGEVGDSLFFSPEDEISMSIEYFDNFKWVARYHLRSDAELLWSVGWPSSQV